MGLALVLVFVLAIAADYFLFPLLVHPDSEKFNSGKNGLWLGSKWYMGKVSKEDFESIALLLKKQQIKYAFFHCKDISAAGNLRIPSEDGAKRLVDRLHELCPGIKIIVWMGALSVDAGGEVDVAKPEVRANMARSVAKLVQTAGFDGVQWDLEPVYDNNQYFLDLLDQTRAGLPRGSFLSVCGPSDWFVVTWRAPFIKEVARRCDQIALMGYDTGMWLPRFYVTTLESLISKYANAIYDSHSQCKFLVGVPAYEDVSLGHHAYAESLSNAIVAVKNAMKNSAIKAQVVEGIAPYAEYTTDASEWRTYEHYWLGN